MLAYMIRRRRSVIGLFVFGALCLTILSAFSLLTAGRLNVVYYEPNPGEDTFRVPVGQQQHTDHESTAIPAHSVSVGEVHGPLRPLLDNQPVLVHILAYQRTASTVLGNMIGDLPGQFFMYEPLDLTFTAMYGTDPGWNIPSDIFNSPDGKLRSLDGDELTAIRWTMDSIYQCQMAATWPMQFLVHPFWFYYGNSAMTNYKRCIGSLSSNGSPVVTKKTLMNCMITLKTLCKGHYRSGSPKLNKCRNIMWKDGGYRTSLSVDDLKNAMKYGYSETDMKNFDAYFTCLAKYENIVRSCARRWFDEPCKASNIRIIKTVRASMEVPEYFFIKYPNFRLIHLFRDPRGASKSRYDQGWSQGSFETRNITRIAKTYCQNVLSDYKMREELSIKYPGQTAQILSDDFMLHSLDYVQHMAELIGKNVTNMKKLITDRMKRQGIEARESEHTQQLVEDKEMQEADSEINNVPINLRKILQVWNAKGEGEQSDSWTGRKLMAHHKQMNLTDLLNKKLKVPQSGIPHGKKVLKGENRLNKWQGLLYWRDVKAIEHVCKDFFNEIPYKWQF